MLLILHFFCIVEWIASLSKHESCHKVIFILKSKNERQLEEDLQFLITENKVTLLILQIRQATLQILIYYNYFGSHIKGLIYLSIYTWLFSSCLTSWSLSLVSWEISTWSLSRSDSVVFVFELNNRIKY